MITFTDRHNSIFDEKELSNAMEWYAKLKGVVLYKKQRALWVDLSGYLRVSVRSRNVLVHRLLMMCHLKRELKSGELVHHADDNKLNNVLSNLELTAHPKHTAHHRKRTDILDAEIKQLLKQGKSRYDIARHLGCSQPSICYRIKRMVEDQSYIT